MYRMHSLRMPMGVNDMYEVFGNKKALKFIEFMVFNRLGRNDLQIE
jgi:hypothetical protein